MGWREFWDFLNKPRFLSKRAREKLAFESDVYNELDNSYNELERETNKLELKHARLQKRTDRISNDQGNLIVECCRLREQLFEANERVERVEKDSALSLGRHLLTDSTIGVLIFDKDNVVVDANEAMCRYLQVERPELVEDNLGKLESIVSYLNIYGAFFDQVARNVAIKGAEVKPNRFKIKGVTFDVMGYATRKGTSEVPVYDGGFLTLIPLQEKSLLEKVFEKKSVVIAPEEPLDKARTVDVYLSLMSVNARHRYVDLAKAPMSQYAIESLAKFYLCMVNSEYTLTFRNVSEEERDGLLKFGVDAKHIRGIRKQEAESPESVRTPTPEPGTI